MTEADKHFIETCKKIIKDIIKVVVDIVNI